MTFAVLCVVVLGGCGSDQTSAVRDKMVQFATATAQHDYTTICHQVLAPDLTAHLSATGVTCEQAWQLALGAVKNPYISVGKITVKGSRATAIVLSVAQNQSSSLDAIGLTKTGSGWRIESLANQLPGG
jgi:hypothetical protein